MERKLELCLQQWWNQFALIDHIHTQMYYTDITKFYKCSVTFHFDLCSHSQTGIRGVLSFSSPGSNYLTWHGGEILTASIPIVNLVAITCKLPKAAISLILSVSSYLAARISLEYVHEILYEICYNMYRYIAMLVKIRPTMSRHFLNFFVIF